MTAANVPVRIGLVAGLTFFGLTYMLYGVSGAVRVCVWLLWLLAGMLTHH